MYEVELKVDADHESIRNRLRSMEATPLGRVVQRDTYYQAPTRDFERTDEALRIRWQTGGSADRTVVTYKGPRLDSAAKTREEVETAVDDGAAMGSILEALGCEPVVTVVKERVKYRVDQLSVSLDTVEGLGEFVEIEAVVGDRSEIPRTYDRACDLLDRLGFDPDAHIEASYLELLVDDRE